MAISTVHHLFLVSDKIDLFVCSKTLFIILYMLNWTLISLWLKQSVSFIRSHLNWTINTQVVYDSALTVQDTGHVSQSHSSLRSSFTKEEVGKGNKMVSYDYICACLTETFFILWGALLSLPAGALGLKRFSSPWSNLRNAAIVVKWLGSTWD